MNIPSKRVADSSELCPVHDDPIRPWNSEAGFRKAFAERLGLVVPDSERQAWRIKPSCPTAKCVGRAGALRFGSSFRDTKAWDCHVLTLTDNLPSALSFDK
eukprot:6429948-Amphidinium_carterae.1